MAEREALAGADGPREGVGGQMRILFVGDLVGGIGRRTLLECLPLLRERLQPTFVVVNGENVAGGLGITPKAADQLFAGGVDAITLGNHTYHRREIYPYLDSEPRILRPANFLRSQPGHGACVVTGAGGERLGVVNLSGNLYLRAGRSAFTEIETALGELGDVDQILVDMHAEATSEKVAMGS
jgi:2',3'-cyclic-nucleotide 2'-phosphodiesterase